MFHHLSTPTIAIPFENGSRPLWSVMIPSYNCGAYLADCLKSVLAQDPGEEIMEIVVVDDASQSGNPAEIVREVGKGRVRFFSQQKNVRSVENFNTALDLSRGKYVHLLHCDDIVLPGYYNVISSLFDKTRKFLADDFN